MRDDDTVLKELKKERNSLIEKRNKLENFLEENKEMNFTHKELLMEQLLIMYQYVGVLNRRIADLLGE